MDLVIILHPRSIKEKVFNILLCTFFYLSNLKSNLFFQSQNLRLQDSIIALRNNTAKGVY